MKLIKGLSWTFFANLIVSFTKWFMVIIIAKVLTPGEVGIYTLAFAISAPITLFANMKLRSLYVTSDINNFGEHMYGRNITSIFSLFILIIISYILYPAYFTIILLVGISKILDLQSEMYYALPHKNEDMKTIGKLLIIKHLLTLVIFWVILIISKELVISLILQVIIQGLFLELIEKKYILKKFSIKNVEISITNVKKLLLLGLPLGVVQMLVSLNTSIPRYLLEFFLSTEVLGYFSAIAYLMMIGNMMMNAISQNFLPILTNRFNKSEYRSLRNILVKLSLFSLFLGISLIIFSVNFGESFLSIIYGPEYANYLDILIIMSIAISVNFVSWNFDTALLSMRYISIQPKISIFILIITLYLSYKLITIYGINGAAYTLLITNSIQLVLKMFFVNQRLKVYEKEIK